MEEKDPRVRIPAINQLVTQISQHFAEPLPHTLLVRLARRVADQLRHHPKAQCSAALIEEVIAPLKCPGPKAVINATGILLHTNLGRAPLFPDLVNDALAEVAGYTDLEMDLEGGKRGHRDRHLAELARLVWGVEDATLVNNAAGAVTLSLAALGGGGETVVSRGELIEIGGSFRLPDIMKLASSKLVEVGTTNKTKLGDYEAALSPQTACLLKTHPSNYRIEGFTAQVDLADLSKLGRKHGLPVIMDLGSGLSDSLPFPKVDEPFIEDYLIADPDLLIFSGDKLFGCIQAGIILGKKAAIARLRKHPMMRMLRADKLSISIICRQLSHTKMEMSHPFADLANTSLDQLRVRAQAIAARLGMFCEVVEDHAYMGGGSLPQERRPTLSLALDPPGLNAFARRMRTGSPAVVGYTRNDRYFINLASVFPQQDAALIDAVKGAWEG